MQIRALGAFYGSSGRIHGAECGASELMQLYCRSFADTVWDKAITDVRWADRHNSVDDVVDMAKRLRDDVRCSLANGDFTLVFGGDHSIAIGSIAGAIDSKGICGVVYIDAHADMNTFESSPSRNIHGMPLAVCMGIGDPKLTAVVPVKLRPEHLLLIGQRSIDPGENQLIDHLGIDCVTSAQYKEQSAGQLKDHIDSFITCNNINRLHVSFDIDVIDPVFAPATGVPEPDGLNEHQALNILDILFNTGLVRSLDVVEYNPMLDRNGITAKLCSRLLKFIDTCLRKKTLDAV